MWETLKWRMRWAPVVFALLGQLAWTTSWPLASAVLMGTDWGAARFAQLTSAASYSGADSGASAALLASVVGITALWALGVGLFVWGSVQAVALRRARRLGMDIEEYAGWRMWVVRLSAVSLLAPMGMSLLSTTPAAAAAALAPPGLSSGAAVVQVDSPATLPVPAAAQTGDLAAPAEQATPQPWRTYAPARLLQAAETPVIAKEAEPNPDPPPPTPDLRWGSFWEVSEGESLQHIAAATLGAESRWRAIRDLNVGKIMNDGTMFGDDLQAGWALQLPPGVDLSSAAWTPTVPVEHTVVRGDHFWGIAEKYLSEALGRPATDHEIAPYWVGLVEHNRDLLLAPHDPALIYPAQVFFIPLPVVATTAAPRVSAPEAGLLEAPPAEHAPGADAAQEFAARRHSAQHPPPPAAAPPQEAAPAAAAPTVMHAATWQAHFAAQPPPAQDAPTPPARVEASATPIAPAAERARAAPAGEDGAGFMSPWMIAGAGVTTVLAAAVLWRWRMLRRQERRSIGDDQLSPPPPPAAPAAALTDLAATAEIGSPSGNDALGLLDAANRQWTAALASAGRPAAICAARVTEASIEVAVNPFTPPPDCWAAHPSGRGWVLRPRVRKADLVGYAGETLPPPYAPTLVPLGESAEGTILLDLERVGVLAVTGWERGAHTLLRSIGEAIAAAPWADRVDVVAAGVDIPSGLGWERVRRVLAGSDEMAELLAAAAEDAAAGGPSTYEARLAAVQERSSPPTPTVVILGAGYDELSRQLCAVAMRRGARLAVVTASHASVAQWRCEAQEDATVILEPFGWRMLLGAPLAPGAVEAVSAAATPAPPAAAFAAVADREAYLDPALDPSHAYLDTSLITPQLGLAAASGQRAGTAVLTRPGEPAAQDTGASPTTTRDSAPPPAGGDTPPKRPSGDPAEVAGGGEDEPAPPSASTPLEAAAEISEITRPALVDLQLLHPEPSLRVRQTEHAKPDKREFGALPVQVGDMLVYLALAGGRASRQDLATAFGIDPEKREWRLVWQVVRRRINSSETILPGTKLVEYETSGSTPATATQQSRPVWLTEAVSSDWGRFCECTRRAAAAANPDAERGFLRAALLEVGEFPLAQTPAPEWTIDGDYAVALVEHRIGRAALRLWELQTSVGDHAAAAHAAEKFRAAVPYADICYDRLMRSYADMADWEKMDAAWAAYETMIENINASLDTPTPPMPGIVSLHAELQQRRATSDAVARRHAAAT